MKKIVSCLFAVIAGIVGFCAGAHAICKKMTQGYKKMEDSEKRFRGYYDLLVRWMDFNHRNQSLERYLLQEGMNRIAIYGMGELGVQLLLELKNSSIEIAYAVDQNAEDTVEGTLVYKPEDTLEEVDAVIVTPIYAFDAIKDTMKTKVSCRIISLEDVVYGMD